MTSNRVDIEKAIETALHRVAYQCTEARIRLHQGENTETVIQHVRDAMDDLVMLQGELYAYRRIYG